MCNLQDKLYQRWHANKRAATGATGEVVVIAWKSN